MMKPGFLGAMVVFGALAVAACGGSTSDVAMNEGDVFYAQTFKDSDSVRMTNPTTGDEFVMKASDVTFIHDMDEPQDKQDLVAPTCWFCVEDGDYILCKKVPCP